MDGRVPVPAGRPHKTRQDIGGEKKLHDLTKMKVSLWVGKLPPRGD